MSPGRRSYSREPAAQHSGQSATGVKLRWWRLAGLTTEWLWLLCSLGNFVVMFPGLVARIVLPLLLLTVR